MQDFPDFSSHGYQIVRELGYNPLGGRVTYLAKSTTTQILAVIKQFQFAQLGASWAEYDAYEQEIKVLRSLNHPGIPRYLDSFQTADGFCMVQEYKNAQSLAVPRSWTPQEIKQVALSILEILAYLRSQKSPVIHRDIKPENILMDEQMNIYLVDFGFAKMGGGEVAVSSLVKGTLGFMPPEQLFNRQLTEASDLYGLGATLICLLTGTKSADIGNLIDSNYRIHFQHLVPPLQRGWLNWLAKLAEPNPRDRYKSADAALQALKPIDVVRLPKVRLSKENLEFTSSEFGEKISQTITINNPIPDTMLAGSWEVAPHPSEPPPTSGDRAWISFHPQRFESNEIACKITVDTSQLQAGKTYNRQILLRANSDPDTRAIALRIQTAPLPQPKIKFYGFFAVLFVAACWAGWQLSSSAGYPLIFVFIPWIVAGVVVLDKILTTTSREVKIAPHAVSFGAIFGQFLMRSMSIFVFDGWDIAWLGANLIGALLGASFYRELKDLKTLCKIFIGVGIVGLLLGVNAQTEVVTKFISILILMGVYSVAEFVVVSSLLFGVQTVTIPLKIRSDRVKFSIPILGLGMSLGAWYQISLDFQKQLYYLNSWERTLVLGMAIAPVFFCSIPLIKPFIYQPLNLYRRVAKYRQNEAHLIKP